MNFPRKIVTALLALILCLGCFVLPASAAGNTMHGIGFVNTTSLRLRSEPSATSKLLDTAPKNDCVVVISKDGDWYKVSYNLQEGYMHKDYLNVLTQEEDKFDKTIDQGLSILAEMEDAMAAKGITELSGEDAFKLYDTYGYPVELTEECAEERGFTIDNEGFEKHMELKK